MIWHNILFATIGFLSSLILVVDHRLSNVCFTRGCDIIRKSKHSNILGLSNALFGFLAFATLLFLFIWYPESDFIGPVSVLGSIYALVFLYVGIRHYQEQCPFCIISNISMLMIFFIWLSSLF